ncbi:MAG TPA: hypothetical protein VJC07_05080 [Candidatus Nanoarchaeia archaeon]|nr:hypothetical protein [Candidatus Nanoarchaeia archaeon]
MTSGEMKVMVFAVLILGIGFVYTTVMDRQGYTGQATVDDYAMGYDASSYVYREEGDYVTAPVGYEEAEVPFQPSYYETPQSSGQPQKQFLMALGIDKVNVEEACGVLDDPSHPFNSQANLCRSTLYAAQQDAAA